MSPTNAEPADEGSFAELFAEYEDQVPVARSARRAAGRGAGRPGTTDDDVEHLLRQRGTVVVIDGYNVAMRGWPTGPIEVRRSTLLRHVSELAQRWRLTSAIVVFDGDGTPQGQDPVLRTARNVRVEFSAAHEDADDMIARMVRVSAAGRRYAVVTDDRDLAARCVQAGASVVAAERFLALGVAS